MHTGRLVGGIVCLSAAVLIAILTFVLPSDRMMFMIGDENMPIIPAIILGVIGVWLIYSARTSASEDLKEKEPEEIQDDPEKVAMNKRLEGIGWGLFLIMLGGFSLVPAATIPKGVWSIGIGLIMLGLNVARYYYGVKLSGFTTFLGILALLSGIGQLLGWHSLDGALLLIILGAYLILKPWFEKREIFGKVA